MELQTLAIHSHQAPDPTTGAVITPIYQTTTFAQEDAGVHKGYDYSRSGNPTRSVLEGVLADLEGGQFGYCFASGLAALNTLSMALLNPGDHVICSDDVYGGTFRFFTKVFSRFGVNIQFVDSTDLALISQAITPQTKLIYLETPSNPLLKLTDIAAICELAKTHQVPVCVDNTFATPMLQRPLTLGADIVLHSTTKYIGGHSDVVGGALIIKENAAMAQAIKFHQNSLGGTPDPFAAWLTLRGLKTLGVRMQAHCENAMALAHFLDNHALVDSVLYPGLSGHPQHALAQQQMGLGHNKPGFGGMISFRVKGDLATARRVMQGLKLFTLAESLGGVESLVESPALMTHMSVDKAVRDAIGLTDNLIRLSVGIEALSDLQADLDHALKAANQQPAGAIQ
jgi:cystathionine gamma-lyase